MLALSCEGCDACCDVPVIWLGRNLAICFLDKINFFYLFQKVLLKLLYNIARQTHAEAILPMRRKRKLRRAPKTPGAPLLSVSITLSAAYWKCHMSQYMLQSESCINKSKCEKERKCENKQREEINTLQTKCMIFISVITSIFCHCHLHPTICHYRPTQRVWIIRVEETDGEKVRERNVSQWTM